MGRIGGSGHPASWEELKISGTAMTHLFFIAFFVERYNLGGIRGSGYPRQKDSRPRWKNARMGVRTPLPGEPCGPQKQSFFQ